LQKIGEVITEQLEIVPAKIYIKQHVRFKYAGCIHQDKVITAAMPNQPIDKGFAGLGYWQTCWLKNMMTLTVV